MWYKRDFNPNSVESSSLPIKILKGPRQVGKTSLLERLADTSIIRLDDLAVQSFVRDNPRVYLDQWQGRIIIDEAPLVPEIFPELKRRVDAQRRGEQSKVNIWLTGSNQTLLRQNTRESLAGRASYFDLNTLSVHELGVFDLAKHLFRGGWPELWVNSALNPQRYLDDFIGTFVDRDIAFAAGIEKRAAFTKLLRLVAARQGMLMNYSELAGLAGVDVTTIQSWLMLLEENGIIRSIQPYFSNLNKRLSKAPKYYFEDVALAVRLQGWTELSPLMVSLQFGFLLETIALSEFTRFFMSHAKPLKIYHLRNKEKVEVDFLVELDNQRFIAVEVKATPKPFTAAQQTLLDSLKINIIDKWLVTPDAGGANLAEIVPFTDIYKRLLDT